MVSCEHCGAPVAPQGKRFCSTTCWYAFTKARRTIPCEVCKQPFERKTKAQRTCSVACSHALKRVDKTVTCRSCGKDFERPHGKVRIFCSRSCAQTGRNCTGRKRKPEGATVTHAGGYLLEKVGNQWVMQHRLVMEQFLGRKLLSRERVHHRNGKRDDNRVQNLEIWTLRGTNKKDPPGLRLRELLDQVIEHPALSDFSEAQRERVRTALKDTFF